MNLQRTVGNRAIQRALSDLPQAAHIGAEGGEVTDNLQRTIDRARGGGRPVDPAVAAHISGRLGADVSGARVHTDAAADEINRALGAEAATVGNDIFFSQGAYHPSTSGGQRLLAHELTHVAQQGGAAGRVQTKWRAGDAPGDYEREAEAGNGRIGDKVTTSLKPAQLGVIQRKLHFTFNATPSKLLSNDSDKRFKEIVSAYTKYSQGADDALSEVLGLIELRARCEGYSTDFAKPKNGKLQDVERLTGEVAAELFKQRNRAIGEFKAYRKKTKDTANHPALEKQIQGLTKLVRHKHNKAAYKALEEKGGLPPEMQNLTSAERKAIRIYTDEAYKVINPVTAQDPNWIGNMSTERQEFGKKVGQMAHAGLMNLPPSPSGPGSGYLFKGESVAIEEAKRLMKGAIKTYPQFLSTSSNYDVAKKFALETAETYKSTRPVAVVSNIREWKSARNIAALSVNQGEKEMLFPPSAKFEVANVLVDDPNKEYKELELKEK